LPATTKASLDKILLSKRAWELAETLKSAGAASRSITVPGGYDSTVFAELVKSGAAKGTPQSVRLLAVDYVQKRRGRQAGVPVGPRRPRPASAIQLGPSEVAHVHSILRAYVRDVSDEAQRLHEERIQAVSEDSIFDAARQLIATARREGKRLSVAAAAAAAESELRRPFEEVMLDKYGALVVAVLGIPPVGQDARDDDTRVVRQRRR
jgi:hypothetical protein